ncbi:MAG: CpaF family protein [Bdellovibrionales bacterium]|nr:CpaF family protein [Bdellovibrionales bacterium]
MKLFNQKLLSKEFENILQLFRNCLNQNHRSLPSQEQKNKNEIITQIVKKNSSLENQKRILSEFFTWGPLDFLLEQKGINEIIINGKDHIFYEQEGLMKSFPDHFLSLVTFHSFVEKISAEARITVNIKKPYCEGRWKDFRVFVLRPPLVKNSFHLCLRRSSQTCWSFDKFLNWSNSKALDILKDFIKQKLNFLIVGATSSGKSSVLNACLQELSSYERVIAIEDVDEIVLPNSISLKLLTQKDPESLKSFIDQQDLVKQSLRLRPDRIVMGEVRGKEAKDLLLALTTGHKGCIGTLHAKDHRQALWKLETLAQMGAPEWKNSTVQRLIFSGLQALVVLDKKEGQRYLKGLYKITTLESSGFLFDTLFERI